MNWTATPPTETGDFKWKESANSAEWLIQLGLRNGVLTLQHGIYWGHALHEDHRAKNGLWCRLVPAEEHPLGEHRPKTLEAKYLDPKCWEGCQGLVHRHRLAVEVEKAFREGWDACAEYIGSARARMSHSRKGEDWNDSRAKRVANGENV